MTGENPLLSFLIIIHILRYERVFSDDGKGTKDAHVDSIGVVSTTGTRGISMFIGRVLSLEYRTSPPYNISNSSGEINRALARVFRTTV